MGNYNGEVHLVSIAGLDWTKFHPEQKKCGTYAALVKVDMRRARQADHSLQLR
jgi:hypothetical protein